jgi:anti-sigma B factor antagonist
MHCTTSKTGKHFIVNVSGRLDATTASDFESQYDNWLSLGEVHIVIDMGGLEYISSAGLRSMLTSAKKTKTNGGELTFCNLQGMVSEVFKMSGFEAIFKVFANKQQATSE